ncbi:MAG: FABP family protein [Propionibacteriaceae bacterium]
MFEIPEHLSNNLLGVAWMIGHWSGQGTGKRPGSDEEFSYGQDLQCSENGSDYLFFVSQLHELDEEGNAVKELGMESGFWRPDLDGNVEAVISSADGYVANWYGKIEGAKIELVTDSVICPQSAKMPFIGGQRLYGQVEGDLLWTFDMATSDTALAPYLWARLQRA